MEPGGHPAWGSIQGAHERAQLAARQDGGWAPRALGAGGPVQPWEVEAQDRAAEEEDRGQGLGLGRGADAVLAREALEGAGDVRRAPLRGWREPVDARRSRRDRSAPSRDRRAPCVEPGSARGRPDGGRAPGRDPGRRSAWGRRREGERRSGRNSAWKVHAQLPSPRLPSPRDTGLPMPRVIARPRTGIRSSRGCPGLVGAGRASERSAEGQRTVIGGSGGCNLGGNPGAGSEVPGPGAPWGKVQGGRGRRARPSMRAPGRTRVGPMTRADGDGEGLCSAPGVLAGQGLCAPAGARGRQPLWASGRRGVGGVAAELVGFGRVEGSLE